MTRGNQRDKAREKNLKAGAGEVRPSHPSPLFSQHTISCVYADGQSPDQHGLTRMMA